MRLWEAIQDATGFFFFPQLALSVAVMGILAGYIVEYARGGLRGRTDRPWMRTLDPLSHLAVSVGLLGSVYSFARAFAGLGADFDPTQILGRLGTAFSTTVFGFVTMLVAGFGAYFLDLATGGRPARASTSPRRDPARGRANTSGSGVSAAAKRRQG